MMKFALPLAAFLVAAAVPAHAWDRMQRSECQQSLHRVANMIPSSDPAVERAFERAIANLIVTPQGICQFDARNIPGMEMMDGIAWRAEGIKGWIDNGIPPIALDVRVLGLNPSGSRSGRPPLRVEATLRQEPDASLLILERLEAFNGAGDRFVISGVMERVILSSTSMMQVSMGAATFKTGLMSMTLGGDVENPFSLDFDVQVKGNSESGRDGALGVISLLPDSFIDEESRAQLREFADDLPRPIGTLEVSVASDRGLGMLQMGAGMFSAMESDDEGGMTEMVDTLFDGLTAQATWSPSLRGTD